MMTYLEYMQYQLYDVAIGLGLFVIGLIVYAIANYFYKRRKREQAIIEQRLEMFCK